MYSINIVGDIDAELPSFFPKIRHPPKKGLPRFSELFVKQDILRK